MMKTKEYPEEMQKEIEAYQPGEGNEIISNRFGTILLHCFVRRS